MEIINLKSEKIKNYSNTPSYIAINGRTVNFTSAAVRQFGLKEGKYIHFMNDGREWSFIVNDDPDGFRLSVEKRRERTGLRIFSSALCHIMKKSLQINDDISRYLILETKREYKGHKVFEIMTSKPFDELGK